MSVAQTAELILQLNDRVSGPMRSISGAMASIERNIGRARSSFIDASVQAAAAVAAVSAPIKLALDEESAFASVRKVMDLSAEQRSALSERVQEMSNTFGMTETQIADLTATTAAAGVPYADLAERVSLASKAAVAFGMSSKDSLKGLNSIAAGAGLGAEGLARIADQFNLIGNTTGANERQMLAFQSRVAAFAKVAGASQESALAFGSIAIETGFDPSRAETAFQNVLRGLREKRDAMLSAGLDASVFDGTTDEQLASVFDFIRQAPERDQAGLMSEFFGNEADAAFAILSNFETFQKRYQTLRGDTFIGSLAEEFAAASERAGFSMERLRAQSIDLAAEFGNALLPSLGAGSERLTALLESAESFTKRNADLIANVTKTAGAFVATRLAVSGLRLGFWSMLSPLNLAIAAGGAMVALNWDSFSESGGRIAAALSRIGDSQFGLDVIQGLADVGNLAAGAMESLAGAIERLSGSGPGSVAGLEASAGDFTGGKLLGWALGLGAALWGVSKALGAIIRGVRAMQRLGGLVGGLSGRMKGSLPVPELPGDKSKSGKGPAKAPKVKTGFKLPKVPPIPPWVGKAGLWGAVGAAAFAGGTALGEGINALGINKGRHNPEWVAQQERLTAPKPVPASPFPSEAVEVYQRNSNKLDALLDASETWRRSNPIAPDTYTPRSGPAVPVPSPMRDVQEQLRKELSINVGAPGPVSLNLSPTFNISANGDKQIEKTVRDALSEFVGQINQAGNRMSSEIQRSGELAYESSNDGSWD
ncbi:phage tail tape measure protein [Roseibium sp.]|uniref:phage tail tape measure protein n=1 Tax=Roseibium sp. TaxID=1936156 RepID=UPI003919010A